VLFYWPVRFSVRLAILLTCVASSPLWCQENRIQDALNSEFAGKVLLLRNFYSGKDLQYDQDGVVIGDAKQGPWTLANVEIKKIAVTAHGIDIVGNRVGTWYRNGEPKFVRVGDLRIHVSKPISDADTQATIYPILSKMFVGTGEDLRSMVPDYWQAYVTGNDAKSRLAAWGAEVERDGNPISKKSDAPVGSVSAPRAISSPDPGYTKEAASKHIEGLSSLWLVIDTAGKATNVAVLEPLGMGLDEEAVLAVKQWKFQPATKNGQPVRVQINVQVNFRCCRLSTEPIPVRAPQ